MGLDKCIKRNTLGECIEWKETADGELRASFKESEKDCNRELFNKWKESAREGKIIARAD